MNSVKIIEGLVRERKNRYIDKATMYIDMALAVIFALVVLGVVFLYMTIDGNSYANGVLSQSEAISLYGFQFFEFTLEGIAITYLLMKKQKLKKLKD